MVNLLVHVGSSLFFLLVFWLFLAVFAKACPKHEREALISFGKDLVFSNGTSFHWSDDEDCCQWFGAGVYCNEAGHVTQLYIDARHSIDQQAPLLMINGTNSLNPSLQQLRYLQDFTLRGIDFGGAHLPKWIASFADLGSLDLSECNFSGPLPVELSHLIHLTELVLPSNKFEGPIPEGLGNMTSLLYLSLEDNLLHGGIPTSLGNLCSLKFIDMSSNYLSGDLGDLFLNLSSGCTRFSLVNLALSENQFTGSIPDTITAFSYLLELSLASNNLGGTISSHIGEMSLLQSIDLHRNSLSGVLNETHFSNLRDLALLDLSHNNLTLNFSSSWSPKFRAATLRLASCKLGSRFPTWLESQLPGLIVLDISVTGISDTIPDWFSEYLTFGACYINLSNNQIEGHLPANLSLAQSRLQCHSWVFDFSSNLLRGPIPTFPRYVEIINLSNNSFSGTISSLCETRAPHLKLLDISWNFLSGEVPNRCIGQYNSLNVLNLANNNLSGPIPSSIWYIASLQMLNLRENNFSGELPTSSNCKDLQFLDLSHNRLSGNVPTWIGQGLSSLIFLSFRANQFIGDIPSQVCKLKNLRVLDLGMNALYGTLPRCLDEITAMTHKQNLTSMLKQNYNLLTNVVLDEFSTYTFTIVGDYIYNAFLVWLGNVREYSRILGYLVLIDVSDNKLSGDIPIQVVQLRELVALNLSRNHFSGIIPLDIGDLRSLQVLDVSRNQLSGTIPSRMSELTFLSRMDLSYNNLSGKIPTSTQILGFDPAWFAGNLDLCGLPSKRRCPGDDDDDGGGGKLHYPKVSGDNDQDEFYKWFYIASGVGFAMSFLLSVGVLVLKHSWRYAYFHLLDELGDGIYVAFVLQKRKFKARLQRYNN